MDSVFDKNFIKIDEQAKGKLLEPQIGDDLRSMNRQQLVNRLQFDQKRFFHDNICPITDLNANAPVIKRHRQLQLMFHTTQPQLMAQAGFVGAFQQTRPKHTMNRKRRIHRRRCQKLNLGGNTNPFSVWNLQPETLFLCSFVVHYSGCQFFSESSSASSTPRIFTPAASSLVVSITQFERGVLAATW